MRHSMNSSIRPITVLFASLILTAFGSVVYVLFVDDGLKFETGPLIVGAFFSILLIAGIVSIAWMTLIITVDKTNQVITFTYPLRFSRKKYNFSEVIGFRFKYLNAKVDYKALQYKTRDGRMFTISDFETSNLRKLESISLKYFDLKTGKTFESLSNEQKEVEILMSKEFDLVQAKDIKDFSLIGIITFLIVGGILIDKKSFDRETLLILFIIGVLIIWMIVKYVNTKKVLANGG
jgi:hypothetical protein